MDGWGRLRPKPKHRKVEDVRETEWYKEKYSTK